MAGARFALERAEEVKLTPTERRLDTDQFPVTFHLAIQMLHIPLAVTTVKHRSQRVVRVALVGHPRLPFRRDLTVV